MRRKRPTTYCYATTECVGQHAVAETGSHICAKRGHGQRRTESSSSSSSSSLCRKISSHNNNTMKLPITTLLVLLLLPNVALVCGFTSSPCKPPCCSRSSRRRRRISKPSLSSTRLSRFRTNSPLAVLPDDSLLQSIQQLLGGAGSDVIMASQHHSPLQSTLTHVWDSLQHPAAAAVDSTSLLAAVNDNHHNNAAALLSWSSSPPEITSLQNFEMEMEEEAINSLGQDVLTFLAASVVVVPLARFLKITPVLIFLAFGLLLGPNGLGFFSNTEADLQLGDFGILFLLFSEGLNLSPERLRNLGAFYGLGVLQIIASMGLFFAGILFGGPLVVKYVAPAIHMDDYVYHMFSDPVQAFCIASAGALSSSAFVLPVLKAKDWENRPEGIAALSVLLLQDLAVAPLLVLLPLVAGSGPQSAAELAILTLKATVGFGAVLAAGSVILRYVFDVVAAARSTETFVAAALLVALGMGQAADALGLSATTGAFAAGVLLAGNRYRAQIKADVRPFEGILLGIFFLTAGASLDPSVVLNNIATLVVGIGAFIAIKAGVLFLAGPTQGKSPAAAARVAITLSGGGEFSLVLFKVAQDLGVLDKQLNDLLVASVILSMSLTPLLGELADAAGRYLESKEWRLSVEGDVITSAEAEQLFEEIDADKSGEIDLEELQVALASRGLSYVSIGDIFQSFDSNGDGVICQSEWAQGVERGLLAHAFTVEETALEAGATIGSDLNVARDAIVVCGYTEGGKQIYAALEAAGEARNGRVVAFELNPARVSAGVLAGANVVYGDGASPGLLRAAGVTEPRAVIVAYRSESKRLEATSRLRESLPTGTPIYARCISGQSLGREELIAAGATDVVNERTESALQFAMLTGAVKDTTDLAQVRFAMSEQHESQPEYHFIPGFEDSLISSLSEEFGCSRGELVDLHHVFSSLPNVDGDRFIDVSELSDVLLRIVGDGPIDDTALERWQKAADSEGGGKLSFVDFARVYYGSRKVTSQEAT